MKTAILLCTCSFNCPSMQTVDFAELSERIRLELPEYYVILHPRLCEGNGENLLADLLKSDVHYLTAACKPEKQRKLLRDGFRRANVSMTNWTPFMVAFKTTAQAFDELKALVEALSRVMTSNNKLREENHDEKSDCHVYL